MQLEKACGRLLSEILCCMALLLGAFVPATSSGEPAKPGCRQAVIEGEVAGGQGFDRVFAAGLRFYLEPLRSGWIVRVLDAGAAREAHDFAEVATPPYQSVSPLLISTDWAFRAQDAVAWNPRHFRYAANRASFRSLKQLQAGALAGDGSDIVKLSELVSRQPEATLDLLDARFAPGIADQAKMAATVAGHLESTPHTTDINAAPSQLGRLESIKFRVKFNLPGDVRATPGVSEMSVPCNSQPTSAINGASHRIHHR